MERDCIISHGCAAFLKERLFDVSDPFRIHVCKRSGLMAVANLKKQLFRSLLHGSESEVVQVYIPYACKLLFQELMAMCIVPRMLFTEDLPQRPVPAADDGPSAAPMDVDPVPGIEGGFAPQQVAA